MAVAQQTMLITEPHFFGEPNPKGVSAEEFIDRFRNIITSGGWNEERTMAVIKNCLHGKANAWFNGLFFGKGRRRHVT